MPVKFRAIGRAEKAAFHFLLGVRRIDEKKWALAEKELKAALRIWPRYASARYCLGVVYWNQKKFDAAATELKAALKLDPKLADAHLLLGKLYLKTHSFVKALDHFSKALALSPKTELRELKEYIDLCKEVLQGAKTSKGKGRRKK